MVRPSQIFAEMSPLKKKFGQGRCFMEDSPPFEGPPEDKFPLMVPWPYRASQTKEGDVGAWSWLSMVNNGHLDSVRQIANLARALLIGMS